MTSESITGMWRAGPPAAVKPTPRPAIIPVLPLARRFRGDVKGEIVLVIGPAASGSDDKDVGFAVDALRHLGVRHIDIPCTPERIWRAVHQAGEGTLPDPWREPPAVFDTLEIKRGRAEGGVEV